MKQTVTFFYLIFAEYLNNMIIFALFRTDLNTTIRRLVLMTDLQGGP